MLLARIVQGAGGGALQPLSQAILLESFEPRKRGMAMAVFAFGVVVAPVLGPTLGGWLTDAYSWRYAFYINVPVGILAAFMIGRFVKDQPYIANAKAGKFDNLGFGLLIIWTGCLQVVLDKGQEDDWFRAAWIRIAVAAFVVSLILFLYHSFREPSPLVNLRVFKDRNFAVGCLLMLMFGVSIYSTITVLPPFYQELLGYTAFTAGLVAGPRGTGSIIGMPVIAFLGAELDARYLLTFGFVVFGVTSLIFGNVTLGIGPTTFLWPIIITGFALSFVFVPITTQFYGTLRNEQIGNASGIFNLIRNIGGSVGISVAQTLLTRRSDFHQNEITSHVAQTQIWFQQQTNALNSFLGQARNPSNALPSSQDLIQVQHYSATQAGAALLPLILPIFVLSRWSGGLVAQYGARLPLTVGSLVAASGFALFLRPGIGGTYWNTFFPAVVVLGIGMATSAAPLTRAVMESVPSSEAGVASGVNNAVSRIAGLLAVVVFGLVLSAGFNHTLDRSLSRIQLSPSVRQSVEMQRSKLAGAQIREPLVMHAFDEAFVSGYRDVIWISVGMALLSALSAQMIRSKERIVQVRS
jgi:DHA2 family multidrug resistance protein